MGVLWIRLAMAVEMMKMAKTRPGDVAPLHMTILILVTIMTTGIGREAGTWTGEEGTTAMMATCIVIGQMMRSTIGRVESMHDRVENAR